MRKRPQRQAPHTDVQRIALQRTLAYLTVIRPGVPMPVAFIENLVRGDLMLEAPQNAVLQNLAAAPAPIRAGLDQLYRLTIGANPDLRADAGILRGPGGRHGVRAVFCGALPHGDWGVDNPGLLAIARLARALVAG